MEELDEGAAERRRQAKRDEGRRRPAATGNPVVDEGQLGARKEGLDGAAVCDARSVPGTRLRDPPAGSCFVFIEPLTICRAGLRIADPSAPPRVHPLEARELFPHGAWRSLDVNRPPYSEDAVLGLHRL